MIAIGYGFQSWGLSPWGLTPAGRRATSIDPTIPTTFGATVEDDLDPFAATASSADLDPFGAMVVESPAGIDPFDAIVEDN